MGEGESLPKDYHELVQKELVFKQETVKAILAFSIPAMVLLIVIVACYKALASEKADLSLLQMIYPALMVWGGIVFRDFFAKGAALLKGGDTN